MTNEIRIREAIPSDINRIAEFQQGLAQESEGKTLDDGLLRNGIQQVFQNKEKGFYLVAESDGQVVGSLLITYEWSDWRNATFWWIQSVYVDSQWRRRGVYRALHDHVHGIASSRDDICGIRLYVERDNTVAQQTYADLGMSHSHYHLYEIDFVL
ncbi:MAG: GNAT family N-acetyltransferase [Chloroflexi bacterium]|nr:GNAT family N-acetyltransferase [Chloroflexota bacterium]MDA1226544.1 GNAT family N-acetyltransferase [Chloroflexota bacterium]